MCSHMCSVCVNAHVYYLCSMLLYMYVHVCMCVMRPVRDVWCMYFSTRVCVNRYVQSSGSKLE